MRDARLPRLLLAVLLATGLGACRRKAPGPAECVELAYARYGVRRTADLLVRGVRQDVDALTTECLLTPYDRELVECTLQGGAPRSCLHAFGLRHPGLLGAHPRERERRRFSP